MTFQVIALGLCVKPKRYFGFSSGASGRQGGPTAAPSCSQRRSRLGISWRRRGDGSDWRCGRTSVEAAGRAFFQGPSRPDRRHGPPASEAGRNNRLAISGGAFRGIYSDRPGQPQLPTEAGFRSSSTRTICPTRNCARWAENPYYQRSVMGWTAPATPPIGAVWADQQRDQICPPSQSLDYGGSSLSQVKRRSSAGRREIARGLFVAGRDASELFNELKETFDQVAFGVRKMPTIARRRSAKSQAKIADAGCPITWEFCSSAARERPPVLATEATSAWSLHRQIAPSPAGDALRLRPSAHPV